MGFPELFDANQQKSGRPSRIAIAANFCHFIGDCAVFAANTAYCRGHIFGKFLETNNLYNVTPL
jgi:hypothetical protein